MNCTIASRCLCALILVSPLVAQEPEINTRFFDCFYNFCQKEDKTLQAVESATPPAQNLASASDIPETTDCQPPLSKFFLWLFYAFGAVSISLALRNFYRFISHRRLVAQLRKAMDDNDADRVRAILQKETGLPPSADFSELTKNEEVLKWNNTRFQRK